MPNSPGKVLAMYSARERTLEGGLEEVYLVLLEESPFLTFFWLASFFVVAPLDGIAHGRHFVVVL